MFSIRQVLISALIFMAVPTAVVRGASNGAQYVGGTVKSIPVNSEGALDFSDAKQFRFNYNGSSFQLPYDQITGTDIESAEVRHVMRVIPEQSLIFSHRKRTLVINYTDPKGVTGTLNFELMAYRAVAAKETIAAKKAPVLADATPGATEWWGDIYWKTKRNQAAWDARAAQAAENAQKAAQASQNTAAAQSASAAPGGTK